MDSPPQLPDLPAFDAPPNPVQRRPEPEEQPEERDLEALEAPAEEAPIEEEEEATEDDDVIADILPAWQVHLFSGASGAGKTTLIAQLCAAIVREERFFSWTPRAVPFMGVIASDRVWRDHRKWFDVAGIGDIPAYSFIDDRSRSAEWLQKFRGHRDKLLPEFLKALAQKHLGRDDLPEDSLIVLDPVSLFLGGDLNHYDRVFTHMAAISKLADQRKITFIAVAHAGKQKADKKERYTRPQDRVGGSTAQTACAGTTLHLAPPTETEQDWSELSAVPHHAQDTLLRLERGPGGLFVQVPDVMATQEESRALQAAMSFASHLPTGEELSTTEVLAVAEACGVKRSSMFSYLKILEERGVIQKLGRGKWMRVGSLLPSES